MNTIKHKHILIFVIIFVLIASAFSIVKVRAMNNKDSSVVIARISDVGAGTTPGTLFLQISIISDKIVENPGIEIPISGSLREMNRSIRIALENFTNGAEPTLVGKNDTLILLGGMEKI